MPMNPYQGLKPSQCGDELCTHHVTMPMNPYQGLKLCVVGDRNAAAAIWSQCQ